MKLLRYVLVALLVMVSITCLADGLDYDPLDPVYDEVNTPVLDATNATWVDTSQLTVTDG